MTTVRIDPFDFGATAIGFVYGARSKNRSFLNFSIGHLSLLNLKFGNNQTAGEFSRRSAKL